MYQIRFRVTPSLLWEQGVLAMHRAQGWSAYLQPVGHVLLVLILAQIPLLCGLCDLDHHSFLAGLLAMYLGKLGFEYFFIRYISRMYASPNGMTLEERTLRTDDGSIEVEGSHYKTVYSWTAVQGVSEGKSTLVLWTDNGSGIVVPKSAFSSSAELNEFRRNIEAKIATQNSEATRQRE